MGMRPDPTGEWCVPTREVRGSQLIRLVQETTATVEPVHDVPTRRAALAAPTLTPRVRHDGSAIEEGEFSDSSAHTVAKEIEIPREARAPFASTCEVDEVIASIEKSIRQESSPDRAARKHVLEVALVVVILAGLLGVIASFALRAI